MADLIKKIKIKKQDGTFTDYIPIGADAVNVETSDGESVELKLNKKPYYYNTVADMKADTKLKIGDVCQILEDTGTYKIVNDASLVIDDKNVYQLNNGLKAQLLYYTDINKQYYTLYQPCLDETNDLGTFNLLVFSNGFTILNDCGYTGEENAIQSFMAAKNINHLDIVMITHFHADHSGCFEYIARNYCNNRTLFFRQMECDYTKFTGESATHSPVQEQTYTNVLTELGYINNSRVPGQNESIIVNNGLVKLRFLNTDSSFLQSYYNAQSDTNTDNYMNSTINNMSMICEVSAFGKKLLLNGDAEAKAQENNWEYLTKCDIMQIPHHNWNHNGFHRFFKAVSPEIAYYNRNSSETTDQYVYWAKFQRQCIGYIPTYQTYKQDVIIKVSNNGIDVISGYKEKTQNLSFSNIELRAWIPYYNDNTYSYHSFKTWTIADVIKMIKYVPFGSSCQIPSSSVFTKLDEEIHSMTNVTISFILTTINKGFELRRASEWDGRIYRFLEGFDYSKASTYTNFYCMLGSIHYNKSINKDFEIGEGETYSIPNQLRNPPTLFGRIKMTEGTSTNIYSVVFKHTGGNNYEAIDTRVVVARDQAFLRAINCLININNQVITVNTCKLTRKNLTSNGNADIFSCKLIELSSTFLL